MIVAALLLACASDNDSVPATACPPDAPVTWNNFGHGFMVSYCLACHSAGNTTNRYGAPEGMDFDTEASVTLYAERLRVRVLEEKTMPVGGGVYADDLLLFERYLNCVSE